MYYSKIEGARWPGGRVAGWQGGQVDSMLESQTSGPGFDSCSDHLLDLFLTFYLSFVSYII